MTVIYTLEDPRNNEIRYVGVDNSTLSKALKQKEYYIKDNHKIQYYECLS